jgi:hypothetical protein
LVGGPPGIELHTAVDELPSGDTGDIVPVVLPTTINEEIAPNGVVGVGAVVDIVVVDGVGTSGVVVAGKGGAQVTTVPGVAGLEASGTGASVVSGIPGWVVAENGLGPLSGEDSMAPGVDERPMAVVPMVET